jgi:hypothetical protein
VAKKVETHLSRSRTHTHHCVFFTAHNIRFTLVPARNPCPACVRLSRSHPTDWCFGAVLRVRETPFSFRTLLCVPSVRRRMGRAIFKSLCVPRTDHPGSETILFPPPSVRAQPEHLRWLSCLSTTPTYTHTPTRALNESLRVWCICLVRATDAREPLGSNFFGPCASFQQHALCCSFSSTHTYYTLKICWPTLLLSLAHRESAKKF